MDPARAIANIFRRSRRATEERSDGSGRNGSRGGSSSRGGSVGEGDNNQRQNNGAGSAAAGVEAEMGGPALTGMPESFMADIFLAQQQAALNHYNRAAGQSDVPSDPNFMSVIQSAIQGSLGGAPRANASFSQIISEAFGGGGEEAPSGPPPASESTVQSLPIITVTTEDLTDDTNKECCICLEANEVGSQVKRLPCGHLFHPGCIDGWINQHCTCPVCRYELSTDNEEFNKSSHRRMAGRRPRYHLYELERMRPGEVARVAKDLGVDISSAVTRQDVVSAIINSGKVELIKEGTLIKTSLSELKHLSVKELLGMLSSVGIRIDRKNVIDKGDLVQLLIVSDKVDVADDEESKEDEIMGIDDYEEGLEEAGMKRKAAESPTKESDERKFTYDDDFELDGKHSAAEAKGESKQDFDDSKADGAESFDSEPLYNLGRSGYRVSDMHEMPMSELRSIAKEGNVDITSCLEKGEVVERIVSSGTVLIADF